MKSAPLLLASLTLVVTAAVQLPQPTASTSTWAAKDNHEGFTVAADAYSDPARTKDKFAKADPYKAGLLAVDVLLKNDTTYPVHVDLSTVRLDVDSPDGQRLHLPMLTLDEAAKEIAHPRSPSLPLPRRLPSLGAPGEDGKARDVEAKLQPMVLQTDVVPPNGSVHGFVFFDVSGDFKVISYASLYVPDVKSVASDSGMIYFEVPLAPKHVQ